MLYHYVQNGLPVSVFGVDNTVTPGQPKKLDDSRWLQVTCGKVQGGVASFIEHGKSFCSPREDVTREEDVDNFFDCFLIRKLGGAV